jgi:hypothetical protein
MVTRKSPASRTTARKAAAPARKTAPAKKTSAKPVAAKPTPAPAAKRERAVSKTPANPTVQAHDVLRARLTADRAIAAYEAIYATYWGEYGEVLDGAVAHSERVLSEMAPPLKNGRRATKEGPARKALAKSPKVADEYFDLDEISSMSLVELRELAKELIERELITEPKIKSVIIQQMEDAGLFREDGSSEVDEDDEDDDEDSEAGEAEEYGDESGDEDDEPDDDDDDEDDEDEDGEAYTLAELKAMPLEELQDLAEENQIPWKGLKQAALIAALTAAGGDDEDEDEEEDDEEAGFEEMEMTEEEIKNMGVDELNSLLERMGVDVPVKIRKRKTALVDLVMENLDEDEDDEGE